MARHFFGYIFDGGKIGRFAKEFDDAAFDEILQEIGGELPRRFIAWHYGDDETVLSSPRIAEFYRLSFVGTDNGRLVLDNIPVAPRPLASAEEELRRAAGVE